MNELEQRLRVSAGLVLAGLTVEAVSLAWRHPTAFIVFALCGGTLLAAGAALFLWSIISIAKPGE